MHSKSDQNSLEPCMRPITTSAACSEPWWQNLGYNHVSPTVIGGNASILSRLEHSNSGIESKDGQSQSHGGQDGNDDDDEDNAEDDNDDPDELGTIASPQSDGQVHCNMQRSASTLPKRNDGCLMQPPQLELVGHSIACASNPYPDPYYGGMIAAYGPQPLVNPYLVGLNHTRMPLPIEMAQEPIYVNPKQYRGILRRRQSRAKAELERKLVKVRKPYLHESRHQHAMKRARGSGGRFAKKANRDASDCQSKEGSMGTVAATSSLSASLLGSEPLRSISAEVWNSPGSVCYSDHGGSRSRPMMYDSHQNERQEKGDCPSQPWGTVASDQTSQRALAMQ